MNIPMFVPDSEIGNYFSNMINILLPYLDTRESFKRWMNFIHNKINTHVEKIIFHTTEQNLLKSLQTQTSNIHRTIQNT